MAVMPGLRLVAVPFLGAMAVVAALSMRPALAQSQQYMLGPGSSVGSQTKVEPKNCVTDAKTGAITCDTQLVNPPGDTPAKPSYTPFGN